MPDKSTFRWTKAADDILREMVMGGKSYQAVADILGVSRNAATGRGNRIGIVAPLTNKIRKPRFAARPLQAKRRKPKPFAERHPEARKTTRLKIRGLLGPEPKPIGHLVNTGDCQYPHGDVPFIWCGHPKQEGSSFCEWHHALCYVPNEPRKRKVPATGQLEAVE